ncbi:hypothetical protein KHO49_27030 [Pseudomonas sp. RC4D1]|uniref:Type VI secretion protein n=2 Tax=Pseudomonas TaxID=286 RepID=A0A9Q6N5R8_9PSED|nr:hypothetical protein [Pseudomonas sp. RC4D1]MBW8355876.1 hypothetical protein [Pseudomonas sp.]PYC30193.1 hypothetical protein DMX08_28025 [Pseudomonas protegens]
MKRMSVLLLSLAAACSAAQATSEVDAARQSLKNYGLANCLAERFPEPSAMRRDVGHAVGMYGVLGIGLYNVLQNEDTLETLHNPYTATTDYVAQAYEQASGSSKYSRDKVVLHACLEVYNSRAFDEFIQTQDRYIRPDD